MRRMSRHDFQKPEITNTKADCYLDPQRYCRERFSPTLATGVFVHVLREHFGSPQSITNPLLQNYVWRSGKDTGIVIEASSNDALMNVGQRPAVFVRRNPVTCQRFIIGDHGGSNSDYAVMLAGSHTVFNAAASPGQAEALVDETTTLLLEFSPEIRCSLCFEDFQLQEIGQVAVLEGSGGQYVVPVTYKYMTTRSWTIGYDLPPIRHVDLRVLFNLE